MTQDPKLNSHSKLNCILACIAAQKAGADEALMLDELFARLEGTLADVDAVTEVVLIDDGSSDSTWLDATNYSPSNFSTHCIALSRNFGKEAALTAGLNAISGEAVVILDAIFPLSRPVVFFICVV